jgi:hypothetical protein
MDKTAKLSGAMIHALEVTGLDDIMAGGPTRAALMRRGLVFKREGSGRFGHFTEAGRALAADMQARKRARPTGPCQAQSTFMCTGEAAGEHLNPLAMLPGSAVRPHYVPMCQPCYEHLADTFARERHTS